VYGVPPRATESYTILWDIGGAAVMYRSLTTALARLGLTDIIPLRIDIALPRGSRVPALRNSIDEVLAFASRQQSCAFCERRVRIAENKSVRVSRVWPDSRHQLALAPRPPILG
jgi:hypothetical protein